MAAHVLRESFVLPPQNGMVRLSDLSPTSFRTIASRKGLKKAIDKGLVFVNGSVGRTGDHIHGGETIECFENPHPQRPVLELAVKVLFEDAHLAVVYKPAGLEVSGNRKWTLEHALPFNLQASGQPDALPWPEPIHRLDYPTSGAVLVGKTASMVMALNRLFETRAVRKTYLAITIGETEESGEVNVPVDGKESLSHFKVLNAVPSTRFGRLNLVELHPHSGRRHQIRQHMAALGNPILGDRDYGIEGCILKGNGLYLHALSLQFIHPVTGEDLVVKAEPPQKFMRLFPAL
jgi:23S rRNA pseudouridine1911/1915/1917 synthase